jgi:hypothetical protein
LGIGDDIVGLVPIGASSNEADAFGMLKKVVHIIIKDVNDPIGTWLPIFHVLIGSPNEVSGVDNRSRKGGGRIPSRERWTSPEGARRLGGGCRLPSATVQAEIRVRWDSGTDLGTVKNLVGIRGEDHPCHDGTNMGGDTNNIPKVFAGGGREVTIMAKKIDLLPKIEPKERTNINRDTSKSRKGNLLNVGIKRMVE